MQLDSAPTRYCDSFYFYANDLFIGRSIKYYGEYTHKEVELLAKMITKDSVVYDIGGNIGYHTVAFASMAREVHSFEPNNKNFHLLEKNTESLDNVYLYNCAASNVDGISYISDYDPEGMGNFGKCEMVVGEHGQICRTFCIDSLTLPPPTMMKIDVEGHELKVFQGAAKTIAAHRPVIFYEAMHGSGFDEIYDFLTALGYKLYWFPVFNFNPENFKGNSHNIFMNSGVINIIAAPPRINLNGLPELTGRDDNSDAFIARTYSKPHGKIAEQTAA
jgi:FkbM family methyltransferase